VEKYCRTEQATKDNMAHAHCILAPKATDAHSQYVIIIAFPLQQRLQKGASMLCYKHIASLVNLYITGISDIRYECTNE
jgi:hypothetical protein